VVRWPLPGRARSCSGRLRRGGPATARAVLDRFYHWADGVQVPELSRLAGTVRARQAEILAFHATDDCSNGPIEAVILLIKSAWNGRPGSANLVGHPRRTAGGATTGSSRPPWQGSHRPDRSTWDWTCTANTTSVATLPRDGSAT
jgi:hypothetical protein